MFSLRRAPLVLALALALGPAPVLVAACGYGLDDDTGNPPLGPTNPWVCPDGAVPDPDAGCLAPEGGDE